MRDRLAEVGFGHDFSVSSSTPENWTRRRNICSNRSARFFAAHNSISASPVSWTSIVICFPNLTLTACSEREMGSIEPVGDP